MQTQQAEQENMIPPAKPVMFGVRIPPALDLALERYGAEVGNSKAAIVCEAITAFLNEKEQLFEMGLFRPAVRP